MKIIKFVEIHRYMFDFQLQIHGDSFWSRFPTPRETSWEEGWHQLTNLTGTWIWGFQGTNTKLITCSKYKENRMESRVSRAVTVDRQFTSPERVEREEDVWLHVSLSLSLWFRNRFSLSTSHAHSPTHRIILCQLKGLRFYASMGRANILYQI